MGIVNDCLKGRKKVKAKAIARNLMVFVSLSLLFIACTRTVQLDSPGNFAAEADAERIILSWKAVSGASSYVLERSENSVDFEVLASLNVTSYEDTDVTEGVSYSYRLQAKSTSGQSEKQVLVATLIITLQKPESFKASFQDALKLEWAAVNGAEGYRLERSLDGESFTGIAELSETSYLGIGNSGGIASHVTCRVAVNHV